MLAVPSYGKELCSATAGTALWDGEGDPIGEALLPPTTPGLFHPTRREGWQRGEMGFVESERLADLVEAEAGAHDLPGGVHARRSGRVVQIGPRS